MVVCVGGGGDGHGSAVAGAVAGVRVGAGVIGEAGEGGDGAQRGVGARDRAHAGGGVGLRTGQLAEIGGEERGAGGG